MENVENDNFVIEEAIEFGRKREDPKFKKKIEKEIEESKAYDLRKILEE